MHALQRLRRRLPGGRDRLRATRSTSRAARRTAIACSACGAAGAIDFERAPHDAAARRFDLVLDLRGAPAFAHARSRRRATSTPAPTIAQALADAVLELRELVGEFEKPKFFNYKAEDLRAQPHRADRLQRRASTSARPRAIRERRRPAGRRVEPHLCVGCGACTTVCPTGAITYAYPRRPTRARRLRTLLVDLPRRPAAATPALLLHSEERGSAPSRSSAAPRASCASRGVPARVHPGRRLAHGAASASTCGWRRSPTARAQVAVLLTGEEAPQYRDGAARADGARRGDARRPRLRRRALSRCSSDATRATGRPRRGAARAGGGVVRQPAAFARARPTSARRSISRIEHLLAQRAARPPKRSRCRPARPFGTVDVDSDACTLCLTCVGACPGGALLDNPDAAAAALHREELRAVRPVRDAPARRTRSRSSRACCSPTRQARKQPRVLNEVAALSLRSLRQAVRHAARRSRPCSAGSPATRCSRAPARRAAEDVRRLPRDRHLLSRRRSEDHRSLIDAAARLSRDCTFSRPRRQRGDRPRRGLRPAGAALLRAAGRRRCCAQLRVAVTRGARARRASSKRALARAGRRRAPRSTLAAVGDEYARAVRRRRQARGLPATARYYLAGFLNEKPLVALRDELARARPRARPRPCARPRTTSPTCAR